ncbi:hypothetical protein ACFQ3W_03895 [Paenibacillus puldeungensis]|uniref:Uncharacterized protein n=1 Tax=Paenibacillus puldeungensis TaxID=696536 RepID=A0ABW3RT37_9BACL
MGILTALFAFISLHPHETGRLAAQNTTTPKLNRYGSRNRAAMTESQ